MAEFALSNFFVTIMKLLGTRFTRLELWIRKSEKKGVILYVQYAWTVENASSEQSSLLRQRRGEGKGGSYKSPTESSGGNRSPIVLHVYQNISWRGEEMRRDHSVGLTSWGGLFKGVNSTQTAVAQGEADDCYASQTHHIWPHVPGRPAGVPQIIQVQPPRLTTNTITIVHCLKFSQVLIYG